MEFEDILEEVGGMGRYQIILILIFLIPASTLLPWLAMNVLFIVSVPDHWCYVPEVAASNLTIDQQRQLVSDPHSEKCRMYDVNYTLLLQSGTFTVPNGTATQPCLHGWQFDNSKFDSTVATQWNLVCHHDHFPNLVMTLFHVGSLVLTPVYGSLSDRFGRKKTYFLVLTVTGVSSILSVFMSNFFAFLVFKTINGGLMPSVFQLPYIIVLELVTPKYRTLLNGIINMTWPIGLLFFLFVVYSSRTWTNIGYITSAVAFFYFIYCKILPESPRWLMASERYEEAVDIIEKIGKTNKKKIDRNELLAKVKLVGEKLHKEKTVSGVNNSAMDLFKYPQLRKIFFIMALCWVADVTSYYGLQLNVANLTGDEFLNFFLLTAVEVPAYIAVWIIMDRVGRRSSTVVGMMLTGLSCMLAPVGFKHADIIFSLIGKFFASAMFMTTYQLGCEIFPTTVRTLAMSLSGTASQVASMLNPYIVYLSVYGKSIPFIIIGMVCVVAGVCAMFIPETLGKNLPQTIMDTETLGRNDKKFWNKKSKAEESSDHELKTVGKT